MPEDYVDPIGNIPPSPQPPGASQHDRAQPTHHGTVRGTVVAVHNRAPKHAERHLLDASVGERNHTELVVRLDGNLSSDLVGQRVVIHIRE